VPVSEAGQAKTPESLAAPALAGFEQPVKTDGKSAMTTRLTTVAAKLQLHNRV